MRSGSEVHYVKHPVRLFSATLVAFAAFAFIQHSQPTAVHAQSGATPFDADHLIVSRSVYAGNASTVSVGQPLPPSCPPASGGCTTAIANGTYPGVWANDTVDASFGVTSPIYLDEMTTDGAVVQSYAVDPSRIVTSFSSKSELGLSLSTDGTALTFMGYVGAGINAIDVSNSNTPGVFDPTNPVGTSYYRGVAQIDALGNLYVTKSNAYSGNNGRAAILATTSGPIYYTVGNSNNGGGTPANVVAAGGVQFLNPSQLPLDQQADPAVQKVGSFSITQVPPNTKADKAGKDDNFRGLGIGNDTLFITKGSGSNGIDTVYQVGSTGSLPALGPTWPINVAPGFPTAIAKTAGKNNVYPFGLWFANASTVYVADEGDGVMADAATSPKAGLQKWTFNGTSWSLAYVMQGGLSLGQGYTVPGYPTNLGLAPAGLRNLTGRVNGDGTVTIWAVTATVSTSGDQGADPNQLVAITDALANTNAAAAAGEQFAVVRTAANGEVLRGVSFAPRTLPSPTAVVTPAPNAFGWNKAPVTIAVQATDDPSGIQSIEYALSGAQTSAPLVVAGTSTSATVSAEGVTTLSSYEQNIAGSRSPSSTVTVRLDFTAPAVTASANPQTLWPPNGKMMPVTISGAMADALSGIDPSTASFLVTDSQGTLQPTGSISVLPDGTYSFVTMLEASRRGGDANGRTYTLTVSVSDRAGNASSASTVITVPHDQR